MFNAYLAEYVLTKAECLRAYETNRDVLFIGN